MRIISGKYKGRAIKFPKGIRPTQAKVRKAIFDILRRIEGLSFLELYAGSGAVGFEAISNGAKELTLVEYSPECLIAIRKNIAALNLEACNLYSKQVDKAIEDFFKQDKKFDIIFLDPPYQRHLGKKTLQMLGAYDILTVYGLVVVQHFKKDILPDKAGSLVRFRQAIYGDTALSFYRHF